MTSKISIHTPEYTKIAESIQLFENNLNELIDNIDHLTFAEYIKLSKELDGTKKTIDFLIDFIFFHAKKKMPQNKVPTKQSKG